MYSVTITKSGQITLPKSLRDFLGVKPGEKITFDRDVNGVTIKRKLSMDEFFAEIDKNISPKTERIAKKNAGKTVTEMLNDYTKSPRGRAELRRRYGL